MVERWEQAAAASLVDVEVIDLRTLSPWDKGLLCSMLVQKTRRCLIVHEDNLTAGFPAGDCGGRGERVRSITSMRPSRG